MFCPLLLFCSYKRSWAICQRDYFFWAYVLVVIKSELARECRRRLLVSVQVIPDQVLDILPRRCIPQLLPQAKYSRQDVVVVQYAVAPVSKQRTSEPTHMFLPWTLTTQQGSITARIAYHCLFMYVLTSRDMMRCWTSNFAPTCRCRCLISLWGKEADSFQGTPSEDQYHHGKHPSAAELSHIEDPLLRQNNIWSQSNKWI